MRRVAGQRGQRSHGGQHGLTALRATSAQLQVVLRALPWDRNLLEEAREPDLLGHPDSIKPRSPQVSLGSPTQTTCAHL